MKKAHLILSICSLLTMSQTSAEKTSFDCVFTSATGAAWSSGGWKSTAFQPNTTAFVIHVENEKIDIKSVAQHLGGWGGTNASCSLIDSLTPESKHFRCIMNATSSKMLVFNPITKNGALISPDGAMYPDSWTRKDSVGIEIFKCI